MPKITSSKLERAVLFEKIIKIVRKHDGNYTAMQDDYKTTQLIMKEIEKWQERVSKLTPLCKGIILGDFDAEDEKKDVDGKIMGGAIKKNNRYGHLKPHQETIIKGDKDGTD